MSKNVSNKLEWRTESYIKDINVLLLALLIAPTLLGFSFSGLGVRQQAIGTLPLNPQSFGNTRDLICSNAFGQFAINSQVPGPSPLLHDVPKT